MFSERASLLNDSVLVKPFSHRTTMPGDISELYCDFEGN